MAKRQPEPKISSNNPSDISFWAALIKELGIPAFVVLFFVICFIWFATVEQKREFIDKYFLLKDVQNNPFPFTLIIVVLLLIIILQHIFYNKILKIHRDENDKLGIEKSDLQEKLLNKKLNSSKGRT